MGNLVDSIVKERRQPSGQARENSVSQIVSKDE